MGISCWPMHIQCLVVLSIHRQAVAPFSTSFRTSHFKNAMSSLTARAAWAGLCSWSFVSNHFHLQTDIFRLANKLWSLAVPVFAIRVFRDFDPDSYPATYYVS
ncbi:hypothetical protein EJ06DRAFT_226750 [Trichodelitschia bisporula]|uniref:Secreted protein n=1 Tax=Trichodelitschia bisporula TaxID=703511 RepID=A0A6G1HLG3_9PEZI|nr:hypothetical protein EJ06DRAFT_226750 [Trichodelitschia bisporula]